MQILQIYTHSNLRNFSYILFEEQSREAICIDPFYADQIRKNLEARNLHLKFIINTHEHQDHVCGNEDLLFLYKGVEVLAHPNAKDKVPGFTTGLKAGDSLNLGDKDKALEVLDTPGHTFSHLCLLYKEKGVAKGLFSGDTLFNAGVGNCRNGGKPEVLFETVYKHFYKLQNEVVLYPGHDYLENNLAFSLFIEPDNETVLQLQNEIKALKKDFEFLQLNMEMERKINTFLRCDRPSDFMKFNLEKAFRGIKTDEAKGLFLALRKLRDVW
ncbi:MAG: hydroxyacylglutathione hydrolase [Leptospiraceae bacterium]|nr:hydroxyacylglutathione hydrolase [Leptospiraceae bacterium]MCP5498282.1 hydroxyacylglutathione hydrolase [Leptospiraceae bacterium]